MHLLQVVLLTAWCFQPVCNSVIPWCLILLPTNSSPLVCMTVNFPLRNTKATPRGDFLLIRKQYCRLSCSTTRHAGAKEKKMFSSYSFLSATLDGDEWSLRPHFTPGTNWIGGWVGLRECLCTEARGKVLCLCRRSNPGRQRVVKTPFWLRYPSSNWKWPK
jgi:hypothetical protein